MKNQQNRTINEQEQVENLILNFYEQISLQIDPETQLKSTEISEEQYGLLLKEKHIQYLINKLEHGFGMESKYYDSSIPWLIYWTINPLKILNYPLDSYKNSLLKLLKTCYNQGFSGSQGQINHLAPTYAGILSLVTLESYDMVNRQAMLSFLKSLKLPSGGFVMHEGGEEDLRAVYIVIVVAKICGLLTNDLKKDVSDYIASCQTYEGGFGAIPGAEAHGGYSFCAYASLTILEETHKIHKQKLIHWLCQRQMPLEGGFNGRTNKVVDACYTFWEGALFQMINETTLTQIQPSHVELQMHYGGLRDKPGKEPDLYHTCYTLSGLRNLKENELKQIDPIFNVEKQVLKKALDYFQSLPPL